MSTTSTNSAEKATDSIEPMSYLFKAEIDPAGAVVRQTMELVCDQIFLTEDTRLPEEQRSAEPLAIYCSDKNGIIHSINSQKSKGERHVRTKCPARMKFIFPPTELVLYTYAAQGQEWPNALAEAVHAAVSAKKLNPLERRRTRMTGKDLAVCLRLPPPPPRDGQEDPDLLYRQWRQAYTSDPAKEVFGYILPQVMAIFFIFTSKLYNGAQIFFWPPDRKRDGKDSGIKVTATVAGNADPSGGQNVSSRFWLTCHFGYSNVLNTGVYTIEVKLADKIKIDNNRVNTPFLNTKTIVFKTYITFETTNAAGSYAVVPCDPVSVEEALMVNFPKELSHLLAAARRSNVQKEKLSGDLPETFSQEFPKGLKPWSERLKLSKSVLGDAASVLEADSSTDLFNLLGDKLWDVLKGNAHEDLRAWVELGFGVRDAFQGWKDIRYKIEKIVEEAQKAKKLKAVDQARPIADVFNMIRKEGFKGLMPGRVADAWAKSYEKWTIQKVQAEGNKVIEACTTKSYAKKINAITKWAGKALTAYALYDGISAVLETADSTETANANFDKLCRAYVAEICELTPGGIEQTAKDYTFYACREAASNLEKMRSRAMLLELKLDKDLEKAMMALHDAALMGMTMIPMTAPLANVIVVAEASGRLAWDFGKTLGTWADQVVFDNALTQYLAERKVLADLSDYHVVNTRHLQAKGMALNQVDLPENHIHLQYRLRTEVVIGLFSLIALCATNVDEKNTLESNLERYKVQQYIQNYVLNDGWAFSIISSIDLNIHKVWLYMIDYGNPMTPIEREKMGLDSNYLLLPNPSKDREGVQTLSGAFYDGSMVKDYSKHKLLRPAAFQSCFPIQVMDSADVADLAKSFKTIHKELDEDCIAYTEIYYRERGETAQTPWRPVMEVIKAKDGQPRSLSPFHQIRVLIVLKKQDKTGAPIKGIYPVELQLMRTDGFNNFKGPTYTGITRTLIQTDSPDPGAGPWPWAGYCGCIIEPFFDLYGAYMPGTKPMAGEIAMSFLQGWFPGNRKTDSTAAETYYKRGHLSNMRYGFKMKIGNNAKTEQWVRVQSHWESNETIPPGQRYFESVGVFSMPDDRRMDYPVGVDIERRYGFDPNGLRVYQDGPEVQWVKDEEKLLSKHLLTSRTEACTYPPLFLASGESPYSAMFAVPLMRLGDGPYVAPLRGFEKELSAISVQSKLESNKAMTCRLGIGAVIDTALEVDNFDWQTPVSFIILAVVKNIDPSAYRRNGLDWREIPFETTLVELTGSNTVGPTLSSRLHYVGMVQGVDFKFVLSDVEKIKWESFNKLKPLQRVVENPELLTVLLQPAARSGHASELALATQNYHLSKKDGLPSPAFHLYAAYLKMEYNSPTGKCVETIRPFGRNRVKAIGPAGQDREYCFAFRNLKTVDNSGLALEYLSRRGSMSNLHEYEFHFSGVPAGWAYDYKDLPWMQPPQPPAQPKTVNLAALKKWIEEKPDEVKLLD
ncbi:MAG: hypothetical protein M0036_15595 [Desulfobacteraceae bacterium]|nr:hypothetical protein [Desulfobacteraceae bacterium]